MFLVGSPWPSIAVSPLANITPSPNTRFLSGTSQGRGQGSPDVCAPDIPGMSCPKSLSSVSLRCRELKNIYHHHHPESKKGNLQRETLAPSNPTVDMEMLERLAKPYLPWRFSGLSRPIFEKRAATVEAQIFVGTLIVMWNPEYNVEQSLNPTPLPPGKRIFYHDR